MDFWRPLPRHAVWLSRDVAALCEKLSGASDRFRDGDGAYRACAGIAHADRRDRDAVQRAPPRLGEQIEHVSRWFPHFLDYPRAGEGRAADAVLFAALRVFRSAFGCSRHTDRDRISAYRSGAALSNLYFCNWSYDSEFFEPYLRPGTRYGHAWPARDEADALSRDPPTQRRQRRRAAKMREFKCGSPSRRLHPLLRAQL